MSYCDHPSWADFVVPFNSNNIIIVVTITSEAMTRRKTEKGKIATKMNPDISLLHCRVIPCMKWRENGKIELDLLELVLATDTVASNMKLN